MSKSEPKLLSMNDFTSPLTYPNQLGIQSYYNVTFRLIPSSKDIMLWNLFTSKLDSKLSSRTETLRIFFDFKSGLPIFYNPAALQIIGDQLNGNTVNIVADELFGSIKVTLNHILQLIKAYFKEDAIKRIIFIFFADGGAKLFHRKLSKDYKINRKSPLANLPTATAENIKEVFEYVYKKLAAERLQNIARELSNSYTNLKVIVQYFYLDNVESDFIPYFYLQQLDESKLKSSSNLVLTTDKDLFQVVEYATKTFGVRINYSKHISQFITQTNVYAALVKTEIIDDTYKIKTTKNILDQLLALGGDTADNIKPIVKGVGYKTWIKLTNQFLQENKISTVDAFGSIFDDLYDYKKLAQAKRQLQNMFESLKSSRSKIMQKIAAVFTDKIDETVEQLKINYALTSFKILVNNLRPSDYKYLIENYSYV